MEISGKIIAVLEARSGQSRTTGNNWMTQDYVIETHEQYPKRLCFNVWGEDKIHQFNIQVGQELTVSFDINAREYQGRWYNDIRAWKVEQYNQNAPAAAAAAPTEPANSFAPTGSFAPTDSQSDDDLPF